MPKKQPLYPHVPKSSRGQRGKPRPERGERTYTPPELADIAQVFYEQSEATERGGIFFPLYVRPWESLAQRERDETISGLQARIDREGLKGYLERKRPQVGDDLPDRIYAALWDLGYL